MLSQVARLAAALLLGMIIASSWGCGAPEGRFGSSPEPGGGPPADAGDSSHNHDHSHDHGDHNH